MTKEQQDLAWQCLPKEVRDKIRKDIATHLDGDYYKGWQESLINYFGHHNLTSDTEPPELLFVERKKVIEYYKDVQQAFGEENGDTKIEMKGREYAMIYLFGDKCIPDQPSVQGKPKFKVGNKVVVKNAPHIFRTVTSIEDNGLYVLDHVIYDIKESDIEPYTEPETTMTEERYQYLNSLSIEEYNKETSSAEQTAFCDYQRKYHPDEVVYWQTHSNDEPETKDNSNMEEKELNLSKLLKGCEGEEFYSLMHGKVRFMTISADGFVMFDLPESISVYDNGKYDLNAEVIIFPSRALYEKYPLDAYSAWMEWKSERTPKRWRAEKNDGYYIISASGETKWCQETNSELDEMRYTFGNYFEDESLCQQATEAVRECLAKFHEKISAQNLHNPK